MQRPIKKLLRRNSPHLFRTVQKLNKNILLLAIIASAIPLRVAGADDKALEYKIKSIFLVKFANFVTWPDTVFKQRDAPIVIGVLGSDSIDPILDRAVEGKTTMGRKLTLKRFAGLEDMDYCHILFVGPGTKIPLPKIFQRLGNKPTLTVGDLDQFVSQGGIIQFVKLENKIHFAIRPDAARRVGLNISSHLLRLARKMNNIRPADADEHRIQPYREQPRYWQYKGSPVLLLGGTVEDNLFQIPDLEAHLDLLASVGGNYVRNTMSDRPDHGYEAKAFAQLPDGRYDLEQWNEEYWQRFANLLRWTAARDIVVQIEVWDRFDHSREPWQRDPFNPQNNINYTAAESGLATAYADHPLHNKQPFFYTVPALQNNAVVLPHQQAFVDKMLSLSLGYDHVLYCMDNETSGAPEWGLYWSEFIRERARRADAMVETTEMWDKWDVSDPTHRATLDHPERYSFVDLSQNSWMVGQTNWDRAQWVRSYIAAHPRPINSTKIYGADTHQRRDKGITSEHAERTFWRNIIGGFASSRFHRPPSGLGLSAAAQSHIRSARLLADAFDFFATEPDVDSELLQDRAPNEAYLTRVSGRQYAVYFTDGGAVDLDLSRESGAFALKWLDVHNSRWDAVDQVEGGSMQSLVAPDQGPWVALLTRGE